MTAKELMDILTKYPKDTKIFINNGCYNIPTVEELIFCRKLPKNKRVLINTDMFAEYLLKDEIPEKDELFLVIE